MNKHSKLSGIGRSLRSENKTSDPDKKTNCPEIVSKYFVAEILEPPAIKKAPKKRKSIEIKCEETMKEKKQKDENQWFPEHWQETLNFIKEMRKNNTAPVDEMGCHKCSDKDASPDIFRYQSLLALMLSSQTRDQVTHAAMERLKAYGCTPAILVKTPDDVLGQLIYPVSFWKVLNYFK